MNYILKRFLKGLVATMLASGIAYTVNVLPDLNVLSASYVSLIVAVLLAFEKALKNVK